MDSGTVDFCPSSLQPTGPSVEKSRGSPKCSNDSLQIFDGWHDALAAAGLMPPQPRSSPMREWSNVKVLATINARWQQGAPLTTVANNALASAARRRFGSWRHALELAGVKRKQPRSWTPQRVLEEIQILQRCGAFEYGSRVKDQGLVLAAQRRFGSLGQRTSRRRCRVTRKPPMEMAAMANH